MAPPKAPRMAFNELGRTGLKAFSGVLYEEFLPELRGQRAVKTFTEMKENNAVVAAMLFAVESLLRSVTWTVIPESESEEHTTAAEFLEENMNDMAHTWEDFISEVLSMLPFGWSYFEQVYKVRIGPGKKNPKHKSAFTDRRIGWRKFSIRSQDSMTKWEFDDKGGIKGMYQRPIGQYGEYAIGDYNEIFIPIEKSLLFRTTSSKGNPEGRSILRSAYRSYYYASRLEEIEAIGIERDLAGMPIAYVPIEILSDDRDNAQEATYQVIKDLVQKTKRDQQEGIIFPLVYDENGNELYKFELMSTGSRRTQDVGGVIQRNNQQVAMTILADFILLGHENVGSFALSSDKTELFAVALGAWLDSIEETLNRYAVTRLFELNPDLAPDASKLPQLKHGDLEKPDLGELATYVQQLANAGMPIFPDLNTENMLREVADLPEADEDERQKMLDMQQQMMTTTQQDTNGPAAGGEVGQGAKNPNKRDTKQPTVGVKKQLEELDGWEDMTDDEVVEMSKRSPIRPTYFDGTRWKTLKGRHRWVSNFDKADANGDGGE